MLSQLFLIHISRPPEMYLDHFSAILGFTFDSAQCNRKSAICGLKIPGQRSRSPSLTKRIAASGNEIGFGEEFYRISRSALKGKNHFDTKMPEHGSPKFNEPWMDELDGENCIQRTVSFAVQGALVGR